jgi:hypothetical protein
LEKPHAHLPAMWFVTRIFQSYLVPSYNFFARDNKSRPHGRPIPPGPDPPPHMPVARDLPTTHCPCSSSRMAISVSEQLDPRTKPGANARFSRCCRTTRAPLPAPSTGWGHHRASRQPPATIPCRSADLSTATGADRCLHAHPTPSGLWQMAPSDSEQGRAIGY